MYLCYGEGFKSKSPIQRCKPTLYVQYLIHKFQTTGSETRSKSPSRNEAIEVADLGYVHMDDIQFNRKTCEASSVSRSSVHRISKTCKFHPYKTTQANRILLSNISFSD